MIGITNFQYVWTKVKREENENTAHHEIEMQ